MMDFQKWPSVTDGYTWCCPDRSCHTMTTIIRGSFFKKSKIVPRRDAATLLPIFQSHVQSGAVVHSDEWRAYCRIQSQLGLQHHTVNHTIQFITPTGVHTNHIESYWNRAKMKIKAMRGCTEDELSSYLDEFMYKERHGRTPDNILYN